MNANMETVRSLLKGSGEINRMREEIYTTIKIIFGFITPEEIKKAKREKVRFTLAVARGIIGLEFNSMVFGLFMGTEELGSTAGRKYLPIPLKHVEDVHSLLPGVLNKMCEHFPELEKRMEPLFRVAGASTVVH